MRAPIGIKIRNRRKTIGISQIDLARAAGISASYLNLIEGNKRDVGGALLIRIAAQLGLNIDDLTGEKEQRLLHDLQELLTDPALAGLQVEPGDIRELVAQFPAMALALNRLYRGYVDANINVETYADRLRADPLLSQLLHQILSQVTAMRSSAEILRSVPDLSSDEQNRFLDSIARESKNLSDLARTLIGYFEQFMNTRHAVSPVREVDDLIFAEKNYFPALEDAAHQLRLEIEADGAFSETTLAALLERRFNIRIDTDLATRPDRNGFSINFGFDAPSRVMWFQNSVPASTRQFQLARLLAELVLHDVIERHSHDPRLTTPNAQRIAYRALASYAAGAIVFPYSRFLEDAENHRYDVDRLKQSYAASFEQVAHRLVTLRRPAEQGIPFGFLRSDPAGRLTKHFPLPGLPLPSSGHACPLWAIYGAFRNNGQIMRQLVSFSDGAKYLFLARTVSKRTATFSEQAFHSSVMLACDILHADRTIYSRGLDLSEPAITVPVGPTCRLCVRRECAHRQEEMLDSADGNTAIRLPLVPKDFALGNLS